MKPNSTEIEGTAEPRTGLDGGRNALKAEIGATLERQLLLAGEPEQGPRSPGLSPGLRRAAIAAVTIAVAGAGAFLFFQARRTWQDRVLGLQGELKQLGEESAKIEQNLRSAMMAKEEEIAQRKAEVERMAALADETLRQLRTSLDDYRKLREEKIAIEKDYRELLRQQSSLATLLGRWVPRWARGGDG